MAEDEEGQEEQQFLLKEFIQAILLVTVQSPIELI
jgi:hypothetical protein